MDQNEPLSPSGECFVVNLSSGDWIEAQIETDFPANRIALWAQRIVAGPVRRGVLLGDIIGIGGIL